MARQTDRERLKALLRDCVAIHVRQGFPLPHMENPAPHTPGEGLPSSTRIRATPMSATGFYYCSVSGVGCATGRSVVAAAAYRAGERLHDEVNGIGQDYSLRHRVVDSFILTPARSPAWAQDRRNS
jgi:hypothetical protein